MSNIKSKIENYKNNYGENETTAILTIMTEVLVEISINLERITKKLNE